MDYAGAIKYVVVLLIVGVATWWVVKGRKDAVKRAQVRALKEGRKRRDEADEILTRPVKKGEKLRGSFRERARARLRRMDLDK